MSPKERKVVQVACSESVDVDSDGVNLNRQIVALCDDGTVWQCFPGESLDRELLPIEWELLPRIPQPEETE